jgi:hypothetical protein
MKRCMMKKFALLILLLCPVAVYSAENGPPSTQTPPPPQTQVEEPKLYDHYLFLHQMQENLAGRSLEELGRMQLQIQRAERQACQRLRLERQEGVSEDEYRQQGGYQFLAFAQQFERYCETNR